MVHTELNQGSYCLRPVQHGKELLSRDAAALYSKVTCFSYHYLLLASSDSNRKPVTRWNQGPWSSLHDQMTQ